MTDKPILFSAPMVRALLEGRKTMTRRVLKPLMSATIDDAVPTGAVKMLGTIEAQVMELPPSKLRQPNYSVGDRLWVRETWRQAYPKTSYSEGIVYRADKPRALGMDEYSDRHTWKPSIFMPRKFSRITLEVTAVKIERLLDISEDDAKAEGAREDNEGCDHARRTCEEAGCIGSQWRGYRGGFANIWFEINGDKSWHANPWVAAYSFKRVLPA